MQTRKLHRATSSHGCGAAALKILLGRTEGRWHRKILAHRKKHKPPRSSNNYRTRELGCTEHTFNSEMRAVLSREFGKRLVFRWLPQKRRFRNLRLPRGRTFLVALTHHYVIYQDGLAFDARDFGVAPPDFRFDHDLVESVMELPGYEIYRPLKPEPKPRASYISCSSGIYAWIWTTGGSV